MILISKLQIQVKIMQIAGVHVDVYMYVRKFLPYFIKSAPL